MKYPEMFRQVFSKYNIPVVWGKIVKGQGMRYSCLYNTYPARCWPPLIRQLLLELLNEGKDATALSITIQMLR